MAEDGTVTSSDPITVDPDMRLFKLSNEEWRYEDTKKSYAVAAPADIKGDIKIKHGSQHYPVNKAALQESSSFFAQLLAELASGQEEVEVTCGNLSSKQLELALDYLHRGNVRLQPDTAEDCLVAAVSLKMNWLQRACFNYLVCSTPPGGCSRVLDLAERLALPRLRQDVFDFLGLNLLPLHDDRQLVDLPEDVLTELLGGRHYVEAPEELVLQVVIDWVNSRFEERKESLAKLLALVCFNLMTPEELENLPPALLDVSGVKERVDTAIGLWQNVYGLCSPDAVDQQQVELRGASDLVVALSTHEADTIQYMRLEDGHVFREQFGCSVAGVLLDHAGIARLGNFLFVVGGYDMGYGISKRVHRYDPRFRNWLPVASMHRRRVNFAIFSSASSIFVVGGSSHEAHHRMSESISEPGDFADLEPGEGEIPLKSCERYDPVTNSWSEFTDLPHGCFGLAGCHVEGTLFVSGGITDNPSDCVPVSHVYKLAAGSNEWTKLASMLCRRQGHCMLALGSKLYAIGGSTTTAEGELEISVAMQACLKNECYDPETNQWTEIAPTPQAFGRLYKDPIASADRIYVLGGNKSSRYLLDYNTTQNVWSSGKFCGNNLVKLLSIRAAVPLTAAGDYAAPEETAETNDLGDCESAP